MACATAILASVSGMSSILLLCISSFYRFLSISSPPRRSSLMFMSLIFIVVLTIHSRRWFNFSLPIYQYFSYTSKEKIADVESVRDLKNHKEKIVISASNRSNLVIKGPRLCLGGHSPLEDECNLVVENLFRLVDITDFSYYTEKSDFCYERTSSLINPFRCLLQVL